MNWCSSITPPRGKRRPRVPPSSAPTTVGQGFRPERTITAEAMTQPRNDTAAESYHCRKPRWLGNMVSPPPHHQRPPHVAGHGAKNGAATEPPEVATSSHEHQSVAGMPKFAAHCRCTRRQPHTTGEQDPRAAAITQLHGYR